MTNNIFPNRNGKYAFNSREFRLAMLVVLATVVFHFTGIDIEHALLDQIADIDWEEWDTALVASLFGVLRYFFTKDKIIGLIRRKE